MPSFLAVCLYVCIHMYVANDILNFIIDSCKKKLFIYHQILLTRCYAKSDTFKLFSKFLTLKVLKVVAEVAIFTQFTHFAIKKFQFRHETILKLVSAIKFLAFVEI